MDNFDLVIVGGATSGAYLAKRIAERGRSVLLIEKLPKEKVGTRYGLFHIEEREFSRLDIPRPSKDDKEWAFEFDKNYNADPLTRFPKLQINPIVGLHMHDYTCLLLNNAQEAGAQVRFECSFEEFMFDENGKICGIKALCNGETVEIGAKIVADCSGMAAACRSKLPAGYGIETQTLTDEDMFYVILNQVKILDPEKYIDDSTFWAYYKGWISPCDDPEGAIIGIGAVHSFEHAEEVLSEMKKVVKLPEYEVVKTEKGKTPYTRNCYSMVADNFFVSGDAGNLTKSVNGEGVTSSMVQMQLATDILDRAIREDKTSRDDMWEINVKYQRSQGADFALLRAILVGVVSAANFTEFQYAFQSGLISDELLNALNGTDVPPGALIKAVSSLVTGIGYKKVRTSTIKAVAAAVKNGIEIVNHYKAFPETYEGFEQWCKKADEIYERIGKIV